MSVKEPTKTPLHETVRYEVVVESRIELDVDIEYSQRINEVFATLHKVMSPEGHGDVTTMYDCPVRVVRSERIVNVEVVKRLRMSTSTEEIDDDCP